MPLIIMDIMKLSYDYLHSSDIVIALLSLFIVTSIHNRLTREGPMLWPLIGMIPSLVLHFGHLYEWMTRSLIRSGGSFRYSGLWRCGAEGIITADPEKIEYMLKTNFNNFPKGKYYRERFYELLGDGIFNADDDLWKQQRRAATSEMHSSRFLDYSLHTMQDLVHNKLLKLIHNKSNKLNCIDLQEVLLRFTFDNICTAAFGVDPGCLSSLDLPDVPFAKAFEEATELTLFRFLVPPFVWKPMRFLNVSTEKRLKEAVRVVHAFAEKTVRQRKAEIGQQNYGERSDLLSRLIMNAENANFSNKLLQDFCISFILAGRDTSSVGLAWFFWLVQKNPRVENKILAEIYEILKTNRKEVKNYNDVVFTSDELKKMVYLQAALSESLRLYPPVSIDFKQVLEDDILPGGTSVKSGERIFYCIFSMGRMESIWGKDCLEFKPERWIKEGEYVSGNQFKYAVFNGGPRLCMGKKFAYMQMKMLAASVLLRYAVKVVKDHQVVPKITTTLYMKNGLLVNFEPRSNLDVGLMH